MSAPIKTRFRVLVRTLYHWATGDSWEQRPLNYVRPLKAIFLSLLLCSSCEWLDSCAATIIASVSVEFPFF